MESFGNSPTEDHGTSVAESVAEGGNDSARNGKREAIRQTIPAGDQSKLRPPVDKDKIFIVDEEREVAVTVLYSTVTFRPNQQLREKRDARLIEIAKANSIRLRTR